MKHVSSPKGFSKCQDVPWPAKNEKKAQPKSSLHTRKARLRLCLQPTDLVPANQGCSPIRQARSSRPIRPEELVQQNVGRVSRRSRSVFVNSNWSRRRRSRGNEAGARSVPESWCGIVTPRPRGGVCWLPWSPATPHVYQKCARWTPPLQQMQLHVALGAEISVLAPCMVTKIVLLFEAGCGILLDRESMIHERGRVPVRRGT
jgi:hypothetical protein